jgi:hypothetical protein
MKILIAGDSFAADWSTKYKDGIGWPNLLAKQFNVTNIAQAGVGEYKIYKQLCSVDLTEYDLVIVSHTSPYRLHTRLNTIHQGDELHANSDLLFADIEYHLKTFVGFFDRALRSAYNFFVHHYDTNYQEDVYMLIRAEINRLIGKKNCLIIRNTLAEPKFVLEKNIVDIVKIQRLHPGLINHLSTEGNQLVYQQVLDKIKKN